MNKRILSLFVAAFAWASICTSYTLGRKDRARRTQNSIANTTPSTPIQSALVENPKKNGVEIKLSDKTIYLSKEQAEKLCSQKINNSGILYSSNPSAVDLSSMNSKSFEFMQKLMDLSAQKLFTFLDNANEDAFKLIREYANQMKLEGKFEVTCKIKIAQDPVKYGKDEGWQRSTASEFTRNYINQSGTLTGQLNRQWENVTETYLGSNWWDGDHYRNAIVKQDGEDWREWEQRYYKENTRINKIHAAVYIIIAHINYHQGVFQAPASLKTDFLKECFYKLDIAHQNKLINNNLVILS